jgi:hypothetical protein
VGQRTDELDDLLGADFVAVHVTGYEQTKAAWLDQIRSGQMRYHGFEEVSATVSVDGDSAVAVTRSLVDATIYGSHGIWPLESTTTYVRDGGTGKPNTPVRAPTNRRTGSAHQPHTDNHNK